MTGQRQSMLATTATPGKTEPMNAIEPTAGTALRAGLGFAALLLAVAMPLAPADASAKEALRVRYDVYVNSMRIFRIKYRAYFTAGDYTSTVDVDPAGFAGLFISSKIDMAVTGKVMKASLNSLDFTMDTKKKSRKKHFAVSWAAGDPPRTRRSNEKSREQRNAIAKALKPGMIDPLTAILRLGFRDPARPCAHSEWVYNGNEVYELRFTHIKTDTFGPKDGSVYRGPALVCQVAYFPIAGLSRKKMAAYKGRPKTFNVWFAPVFSKELNRNLLLPVGATGTLKGKSFVAYANAATIAGKPLNAASLASR